MVKQQKTVREIITSIGQEFYGDAFQISEGSLAAYKKTFEVFVKKRAKKGVFVVGGVGVGKSSMMKVYQRLFKDTEMAFKWANSHELRDMSEELKIGEIKAVYGRNLKMDLYLDDIGVSFDTKRYGNTVNIISEIIIDRYELFVATGIRTHFSSNLVVDIENNINNFPTLKKMYGLRVTDRMREMCEMVVFKGESLRK